MTLAEKKAVVAHFIRKCNEYADGKLAQYRNELEHTGGMQALVIQDKIGHWTAYRAFNDYTIEELETEALDHWFA
jgi:hypothetical protein